MEFIGLETIGNVDAMSGCEIVTNGCEMFGDNKMTCCPPPIRLDCDVFGLVTVNKTCVFVVHVPGGNAMRGVIFLGKIDLILVGVGMDVGLDTINGGDFCSSFRFFLPV
jgi:hypothetical protein